MDNICYVPSTLFAMHDNASLNAKSCRKHSHPINVNEKPVDYTSGQSPSHALIIDGMLVYPPCSVSSSWPPLGKKTASPLQKWTGARAPNVASCENIQPPRPCFPWYFVWLSKPFFHVQPHRQGEPLPVELFRFTEFSL